SAGDVSNGLIVWRPECLVDASRSRNEARILLVEVAKPELAAVIFDIGDVLSVARDGKLGVDVGVAPSHQLLGRDRELHGSLRVGIGHRFPEYSRSNEHQHRNDWQYGRNQYDIANRRASCARARWRG